MIPSVLSDSVTRAIEDFLLTTFPITNNYFAHSLKNLFRQGEGIFQGPM